MGRDNALACNMMTVAPSANPAKKMPAADPQIKSSRIMSSVIPPAPLVLAHWHPVGGVAVVIDEHRLHERQCILYRIIYVPPLAQRSLRIDDDEPRYTRTEASSVRGRANRMQ